MKIYTKTGDSGETSLFGGGRVWKDNTRISAYGTIDELNSVLGLAVVECLNPELKNILMGIQNQLFSAGSDLATPLEFDDSKFPIPRIKDEDVILLENLIDKIDVQLPQLKNFILPGGSKCASFLHLGRTVCRRAEREVVTLAKTEKINEKIEVYLNRLSDLLFVLARYDNYLQKVEDVMWQK